MSRILITAIAILFLTIGISGCNPKNSVQPAMTRYEYGCLEVWWLSSGKRQYLWSEPSQHIEKDRHILGLTVSAMAKALGLPSNREDHESILNHLSNEGWHLVSVINDPPREREGIITPHYNYFHFQRIYQEQGNKTGSGTFSTN